jgi:hypothetical protein
MISDADILISLELPQWARKGSQEKCITYCYNREFMFIKTSMGSTYI